MANVTRKTKPKSAPTRTKTEKEPVAVQEPVGKYINPLTDFGFKFIFGTKEYLIDFLNTVLKIEGGIVDLQYSNTERKGLSEKDRTTIFDLFCTLKNGERVIIEMQYHRYDNFTERTLYYVSRLIQEQGEEKKGDKDWEFDLKPVYSVNIVNFPIDTDKRKRRNQNKYITYAHIIDRDTHKIICDKLTFVYLELPYFTKSEHEVTDNIDWWMYVIKNMSKLNHLPDALRNRIFERLFLKAEIAKLSKEERKKYDQSIKDLSDMSFILAQKDRKIAELSKDVAALSKDNATKANRLAEQAKRLAEYERKYGALSGTTPKTAPTRTRKARAMVSN